MKHWNFIEDCDERIREGFDSHATKTKEVLGGVPYEWQNKDKEF